MSEKDSPKIASHVFVWYGDAGVIIGESVAAWRAAFAQKYGAENFVSLAGEDLKGDDGAGALHAAVANQSLFSTKRFVVLRLTAKLDKTVADTLATVLAGLASDTTLVIWYEGKPEEKSAWVKSVRVRAKTGAAAIKAFWLQGSRGIKDCRDEMVMVDPIQFVRQLWHKRGASAEPRAAQYLVERVGHDIWQLKQEAEKCADYVGATGQMTKEVIAILATANIEEDIFALVDAVGERRLAEALRGLEEHLLQEHDPHYVLSMLARQVRLLIDMHIFNGVVPGLNPFVARKAQAQARRYSREELERLLNLVLQLELKLKTTSLPASALLTKFLVESAGR